MTRLADALITILMVWVLISIICAPLLIAFVRWNRRRYTQDDPFDGLMQ